MPFRALARAALPRRRPGIGLVVLLLGVLTLCLSACAPYPGKLREQWERSNEGIQIRAEIFDEGSKAHFFDTSCQLRLTSAPTGSIATWS